MLVYKQLGSHRRPDKLIQLEYISKAVRGSYWVYSPMRPQMREEVHQDPLIRRHLQVCVQPHHHTQLTTVEYLRFVVVTLEQGNWRGA